MFKETQYKNWFKLNRPRERAFKQFKCTRPQCVNKTASSTDYCYNTFKFLENHQTIRATDIISPFYTVQPEPYLSVRTKTHGIHFIFVNCICLACIVVMICVFVVPYVYLLYYLCIAILTLDAGLLARSQYPEGPATGHLDTGFSWFPCVYRVFHDFRA